MESTPPPKPASRKATGRKASPKTGAKTGNVRPFERPRGGGPKPVGDLMPQVGRTAFRRYGFVQSSVVTRWPEIVGPEHAKVCAPEAIRFAPGEKSEGTLQLVVAPAHAPIIQHVIPEIIERTNRFFGYRAIARVKMRQGPVQVRAIEGGKSARPPELKPIPMELGDSLRDIGDPELRAVLEGLARTLGDDGTEGTKS